MDHCEAARQVDALGYLPGSKRLLPSLGKGTDGKRSYIAPLEGAPSGG